MNISLLLRIIIGLAFFQGALNYIGISSSVHQLLLESLLLVMFVVFFYIVSIRPEHSLRTPGMKWFLLLTGTVIFSSILNKTDAYSALLFYRQILWPYFIFIAVLNLNLSDSAISRMNKFIVFIVLLQIPAAVYKYVTFGVREGVIIGTFANQDGSKSTIFPLMIIGYLTAFYYVYKRSPVFLLLIPCYMFFAWAGAKRGFFFFMPVLAIFAYLYYAKRIKHIQINWPKLIRSLLVLLVISAFTIYLGTRASPRLNPERSSWGTFDYNFMKSQVLEYETRESTHGGSGGRIVTTNVIFNLLKKWDLKRQVLGDGPDRLYLAGDHRRSYGIGYGITGLVFSFISIGVLGAISLMFIYLKMGFAISKKLKSIHDPFYKAVGFGTILATFVFSLDFLFYSRAFLFGYVPSFLFFYLAAIVLRHSYAITEKPFEQLIIDQASYTDEKLAPEEEYTH